MWKKKLKKPVNRDVYIFKLLEKVRGKKLYLFGAGIGGSRAGQILLENGICEFEFIDNNKQK